MVRKRVLRGNIADSPSADSAIARYAGKQHTLIRIDQLLAAGLSRSAVSKRVARGVLFRRQPGVYSLTEHLSREAEFLAAVFAGGPGGLLSHDAGVELLRLTRYRAARIDVVVPHHREDRPGIRFHRCRNLHWRDRTSERGIPVTSVPRLLVDLTDQWTPHEIAAVIHEAACRGRFSLLATNDAIERANGRRHLGRLQ